VRVILVITSKDMFLLSEGVSPEHSLIDTEPFYFIFDGMEVV
jgi:hypothetical protein